MKLRPPGWVYGMLAERESLFRCGGTDQLYIACSRGEIGQHYRSIS